MKFKVTRYGFWWKGGLAAMLLPGMAMAQSARPASVPCHQSPVAGAQNIWMPVEEGIRLYSDGEVRLFWLDTEEPACCSSHLMVVMPNPDMPGQICRVFSMPNGEGFRGLDLAGAEANYDPNHGLLVGTAVNTWQGDGPGLAFLMVLINQGEGTIEAQLMDP
ncbi:MAG: hypothetical protein HWE35_10185 [Rhodobacteraceae bacterium]|nr:hypothetical protein [Paracoccaceae bacterium]